MAGRAMNIRNRPLLVVAFVAACLLITLVSRPKGSTLTSLVGRSQSPVAPAKSHFRVKRKLQIIKAGGIPKEGLGSSLGFITAVANIATLLDAELIISQTAEMMGYRASDILNKGLELKGGGRVCDIMEVLLDDPSFGHFQERMDRAQGLLDITYERAIKKCTHTPTEVLLNDYAIAELARCDTLVINDYRTISRGWTRCSQEWWSGVIDQYGGPAHGNDVAIHFRWGDMYHKAQTEDKWALDMKKVSRYVDMIREANPSVVVNVYMKKSKENESEKRMREILQPLSGDFNIIEAEEDVDELGMMAKARYLFINSGSFSTAAAATGNAQVVVYNHDSGRGILEGMNLDNLFHIDRIEEDKFRRAIAP